MRPKTTPLPLLLMLVVPGLAWAAHRPPAEPLPPALVPDAPPVPSNFKPPRPEPTPVVVATDAELAEAADTPDEPAVVEEIDKDSAEIEAMRQAEEAAHVDGGNQGKPSQERISLLPQLNTDLATLRSRYDIPIDVNGAVASYIRFFQSRLARPHFVKWLGRSSRYIPRFREILKEEGVPQDTVYLAMIESGFGNFAKSRAKAVGNWQFIAATAKHYGLTVDFWVDERRDPEKAARAAARYLSDLYQHYADWRLAWAGYNAGGGRIARAQRMGYGDFWDMAAVPGRKVLRAETKDYVPKLMAAAIISKHPEEFGFAKDEIEQENWEDYQEVEVKEATLLSLVARAAGTTEKDIIDLNPELRRACTPPRPYKIKIPKAAAEQFAQAWPSLKTKNRVTFAGHVVHRGDTLSSIAARYSVPVQGIVEMNGLKNAKRLRLGQEILVPRPLGSGLAAIEASAPVRARTVVQAEAVAPQQPVAAVAAPTRLKVKSGDTLWKIAQRFGVELADLCRWNGIRDPLRHRLMVGAVLVVHGRG